ncbi:MAG: arsenate reductase family protein [Gammaproteobacteria bacterium]|nr:arsenate reductase family protein [Gammaproteobacteria bacterium]
MRAHDHIVIYHNPACSKSRGALEILREHGVDFEVVEYLRNPLDEDTIRRVLDLIDDAPADLVRKDQNFKDLGLDATDFTEAEQVARLLAENPKLMQRPVVVRGERAVIARPSEKVASLL